MISFQMNKLRINGGTFHPPKQWRRTLAYRERRAFDISELPKLVCWRRWCSQVNMAVRAFHNEDRCLVRYQTASSEISICGRSDMPSRLGRPAGEALRGRKIEHVASSI